MRSNRREDGFTMADKEIGYQGVDIGDLVVHGMDGFAGAIGISVDRYGQRAVRRNGVLQLRRRSGANIYKDRSAIV